jgi:regulator of sirC expression with transglutaminase-like and TPR domain
MMMINPKEIEALVKLLDDTDADIFSHVEDKLLSYGSEVIPALENFWEQSLDVILQQRIEDLIHKIQFQSLKHDLQTWALSGAFDLLSGFILVSRYQYPDLDEQKIIQQIDTIKRDAWIELSYDTSPVEKVKILNHVFYNIHGFTGNTTNYQDPQNSYINVVLETRRGNQISLAIIYSVVAQKLDIPIYGVNLPQHFILAYRDEQQQLKKEVQKEEEILFYINAFNKGFIFTKRDVDYFLKQLNLTPDPIFYRPCSNLEIIRRVIRNLINAYEKSGLTEKVKELQELYDVIEDIS